MKKTISILLTLVIVAGIILSAFSGTVLAATEWGSWSGWQDNYVASSSTRQVETRSVVIGYYMVLYQTQEANSPNYRNFRGFSVNGNYAAFGLRSSYGEFHWTHYFSKAALDSATRHYNGQYLSYKPEAAGYQRDNATSYLDNSTGLPWFIEREDTKTQYRYRDQIAVPTFNVIFRDWDGKVLKEQKVERGRSASPPANPSRSGYTFTGWSGAYTNVQVDTILYAQYRENAVHIPVTSITGVPTTATAGTPLALTGTVNPSNATYKTIMWDVTSGGSAGSTISGSTLYTTTAGTVMIRATIFNGKAVGSHYIQDFYITVNENHVPVTSITGAPTTVTAGTPLTLSGTINPSNATNKTITWGVASAGTTGATISGNTLNTTAAGTVTISASITNGTAVGTNYTQYFTITVTAGHIPVTSITGVPTTATAGTPLALTGTVNPSNTTNKTITWSVASAGTTGATISGSTLNTTAAGTVTISASVTNGTAVGTNYTQYFTITVTAGHIPVTSITGVPTTATAGTPLALTGNVNPSNATNKTITWSVVSAGTTGTTISGSTLNTTAAGTVTISASISNGTAVGTNYTQNFTITVSTSQKDPFTMGEDNYRFSNSRSSFDYGPTYYIPLERFLEIFTYDTAQMYYKAYALWGGSCFGFAASSYAFEVYKLRQSDYQSGVNKTYNFSTPGSPNSAVTKLIELYQISQFLPILWNTTRVGANYNNLPALVAAVDNEDGLIVCVRGIASGHAVIAYGIESLGGTSYSLKIYDNNQPNNTNLRIEVDTSKSGNSAWKFVGDEKNYLSTLHENIAFIDGALIYNEIQKARTNKSYGMGGMQINIPAVAEITDERGVRIENIDGAYKVIPFAIIPADYEGNNLTPLQTTEMWVVPSDDYKVEIKGTENTSISVLDDDRAFTVNLLPSNNSVSVTIGGTVDVEGAVHGNITEYHDDGTELLIPIIAASTVDLAPGGDMEIAEFSDVTSNSWFNSAVTSVATVGIVEGVGNRRFDPQGTLTVAQLITMLMRTQYGRMSGGSQWYSAYIERAKLDGIVFESDNLDPAAQITRAQAAQILSRYIEKYNPRWAKNRVDNTPVDLGSVPAIYQDAVKRAFSWNLIRGDDTGRFNPQNTLSRAEAAQMLYNYFSIVD